MKVNKNKKTNHQGGLTKKDFSLARQCDEVLSKFSVP